MRIPIIKRRAAVFPYARRITLLRRIQQAEVKILTRSPFEVMRRLETPR